MFSTVYLFVHFDSLWIWEAEQRGVYCAVTVCDCLTPSVSAQSPRSILTLLLLMQVGISLNADWRQPDSSSEEEATWVEILSVSVQVCNFIRTSWLPNVPWNSPLDGLQSQSTSGTATKSPQCCTESTCWIFACIDQIFQLHESKFLDAGLSNVHERSMQRSVPWRWRLVARYWCTLIDPHRVLMLHWQGCQSFPQQRRSSLWDLATFLDWALPELTWCFLWEALGRDEFVANVWSSCSMVWIYRIKLSKEV